MAKNPWDDLPLADAAPVAAKNPWDDLPMAEPPAAEQPLTPPQSAPPPANTPGILQSLARGGAQGASFGFADELAGAYDALSDLGSDVPIGERYRKGRDESRAAYKAAEDANPKTFGAGQFGAALATLPLGGAAARSATLAGRLGLSALGGAGLGGLSAAGSSEADTTKQLLKDIALGGAVGAGAGLVGAGIGEGSRWLKGKATAAVAKAEEKIAQKAAEKQAKAVASLRGELGAESQKASRQVENMLRVAGDKDLDPALRKAAADWLAGAEGIAQRERVLQNTLRDAPGQVGKVNAAEETLKEMIAAGEGNVAKDIEAGKSLRETFKTQVAPRFATMGSRAIPPALGALLGGEEHRGTGFGIGSAASLMMGNPTLVLRNMVRAPSVQRAAAMGLERLASPLAAASPAIGVGAAAPLARGVPDTRAMSGARPADPELLDAWLRGQAGRQ